MPALSPYHRSVHSPPTACSSPPPRGVHSLLVSGVTPWLGHCGARKRVAHSRRLPSLRRKAESSRPLLRRSPCRRGVGEGSHRGWEGSRAGWPAEADFYLGAQGEPGLCALPTGTSGPQVPCTPLAELWDVPGRGCSRKGARRARAAQMSSKLKIEAI